MSLWKWIVLAAFVSVAAVLAARKISSLRAQLLAQFPPDDPTLKGNIWEARRHLNPDGDGASAPAAEPEPDPKRETRRS